MNAVEIEEAVSALAERPFDASEFPFAFLEAFGNKATTIKRAGASNRFDLAEGVLQTDHIHIAVAEPAPSPRPSPNEKSSSIRRGSHPRSRDPSYLNPSTRRCSFRLSGGSETRNNDRAPSVSG